MSLYLSSVVGHLNRKEHPLFDCSFHFAFKTVKHKATQFLVNIMGSLEMRARVCVCVCECIQKTNKQKTKLQSLKHRLWEQGTRV